MQATNNLMGSIPPELRVLSHLQYLNLTSNMFENNEPSLDGLESMRNIGEYLAENLVLELSNNLFDMNIPTWSGQYTN